MKVCWVEPQELFHRFKEQRRSIRQNSFPWLLILVLFVIFDFACYVFRSVPEYRDSLPSNAVFDDIIAAVAAAFVSLLAYLAGNCVWSKSIFSMTDGKISWEFGFFEYTWWFDQLSGFGVENRNIDGKTHLVLNLKTNLGANYDLGLSDTVDSQLIKETLAKAMSGTGGR